MTDKEFISVCIVSGYAKRSVAKQYVKDNPKEDYDMNDIIKAYRLDYSNWIIAKRNSNTEE